MSKKRILVVAAVIRGRDGRILLARRPEGVHQGGLWEFPGGKVEAGEAESDALVRELQEELGITPSRSLPLIRIRHDYPDKRVELAVWDVSVFLGEDAVAGSTGREGQQIAWFRPDELSGLDFPAANVAIVAAARLPASWRITPACTNASDVMAWAGAGLE
ncbi:MAG: 8-oxo-dGTP diphosphatase MutT, partial [Perlucidibaca sp.]